MADTTQFDLFAGRPRGPKVYSVGEFTRDLKSVIEGKYDRIAIQGEISNLSRPASGHVYFSIKDATATLAAVIFRNEARLLKFQLMPGQQVVCRGKVTVYEPRGNYQLMCDTIEPTGVGALALAFEQLKMRLAAEGLFAAERKRPIPRLPVRIGVVTSPTGAAIRDFLRVLHQRFPNSQVLIAPARVQGDGAAREIAEAIRALNAVSARAPEGQKLDVLVVTRGGGSIEDLWAFNEEAVARAIARSALPVVSAVGHEVDVTIADFAADKRSPTPTAAAELLAPELHKEQEVLRVHLGRLRKAVEQRRQLLSARLLRSQQHLADPRRALAARRLALEHQQGALERHLRARLGLDRERATLGRERLFRQHPRERLRAAERALRAHRVALAQHAQGLLQATRSQLAELQARLLAASPTAQILEASRALEATRAALVAAEERGRHKRMERFGSQAARLDALSPLAVLSRGYAIAFAGPRVLRASTEVRVGESVRVLLPDRSELEAAVTALKPPPPPP
jgi:exodeoxyribonuclease VII large subunit